MSAVAAPFFTVVMPLYNKSAYIDRTLASIAAQTFEDYELIVVDDGSTDDGSARISQADGRVRLVRQTNAGPGAARNRGIAEARGQWIAFIDADDLWTPAHLATLSRTITDCPEAVVVASGFTRAGAPTRAVADIHVARYIDYFREYNLIWTSATAVRTRALQTVRFGILWPGEDVDLWIRLAVRHQIAVTRDRTAIYVQNTGGIMDSQAAATMSPIADHPVFVTIAAILADPELVGRHEEVAAFRDQLLVDYARPALFNGQTALAQAYLSELSASGRGAPLLYHVLAHMPAQLTRVGSRTYGAIKRWLA